MKGLSVPCQLPGFLHLLRRKTVRAAPYLASSSLAPRNHLFSISAGSPGIPSRKPGPRRLQSAQTASLAFSDLGLSSVGIPQWRRQSKDSSMDKGALLVETKVAAPLTVLLLNHLHWYGSAATIAMQKLPLTTVLLSSLTWDQ